MSRVSTFRGLRSSVHSPLNLSRFNSRRFFASKPDEAGPNSSQKIRFRLERLNSRTPRFLQRYTTPLVGAPLTHITAFLVLHELTAIVPVLGLTGVFHYIEWVPASFGETMVVSDSLERFHTYFQKKGWLGGETSRGWWNKSQGLARLPLELVTAYAIVKVLMPLRIMVSVAATPWFARIAVEPLKRFFKSISSGYLP